MRGAGRGGGCRQRGGFGRVQERYASRTCVQPCYVNYVRQRHACVRLCTPCASAGCCSAAHRAHHRTNRTKGGHKAYPAPVPCVLRVTTAGDVRRCSSWPSYSTSVTLPGASAPATPCACRHADREDTRQRATTARTQTAREVHSMMVVQETTGEATSCCAYTTHTQLCLQQLTAAGHRISPPVVLLILPPASPAPGAPPGALPSAALPCVRHDVAKWCVCRPPVRNRRRRTWTEAMRGCWITVRLVPTCSGRRGSTVKRMQKPTLK